MSHWEILFLFLSGLSGWAVLYLPASLLETHQKTTRLFLTFGGAYLLGVCLFHIFPEIYRPGFNYITALCLGGGFILQIILENFSGGIEHGHMHAHSIRSLLLVITALMIHSTLETGALLLENHTEVLTGIIIHNIPVSLFLCLMLREKKLSPLTNHLLIFLFALSGPLGYFLMKQLAKIGERGEQTVQAAAALSVGIIFHISTIILFESDREHKVNYPKLLMLLLGITLAFITLF